MTNPLAGSPLLRISYQLAKYVKPLANKRTLQEHCLAGVMLGIHDVKILRAPAGRNIIIRLERLGQPAHQGRVQ